MKLLCLVGTLVWVVLALVATTELETIKSLAWATFLLLSSRD